MAKLATLENQWPGSRVNKLWLVGWKWPAEILCPAPGDIHLVLVLSIINFISH
jgi:hypothetical protein